MSTRSSHEDSSMHRNESVCMVYNRVESIVFAVLFTTITMMASYYFPLPLLYSSNPVPLLHSSLFLCYCCLVEY